VLALEPAILGDAASGKRPITAVCPSGVLSATDDPELARAWWDAYPLANVGIAIPGDWIVVDVDPRNGGGEAYDAIAKEHGAWPDTLEAATGGGGAHVVYHKPLAARFPGKIPGRKGLEVKQVGGYIVAAPSVHFTGGRYEWANDVPPAPLPEWLAALERGEAAVPGDPGARDRQLDQQEEVSLTELAAVIEPHFQLGQRNALALAIGGALRNAGLPPSAADHVIGLLPSTAPEKRLADALRAWRVPAALGMGALKDILPADAMAAVEAVDLRPEWQRRTKERQVELAKKKALDPPVKVGGLGKSSPPPGPETIEVEDDGTPYDWFAKYGRRADRTTEPPPIEYVIDGLPISKGGKVNALVGAPNAGKSPFAMLLAECVAGATIKADLRFLGRRVCAPGRVAYLDAETGVLAERRDARMCVGLGLERAAVPLDLYHFEQMLTEEFLNALEWMLGQEPHALVIVDTYAACLDADIDHNSAQFAHWLRQLARVSRATDVPFLVLMHEKKAGGTDKRVTSIEMAAGSFQAMGAVQSVITLYHPDDEDTELVNVHCTRAPEGKFPMFAVRWRDTDEFRGLVADVVEAPPKPLSKAEQKEIELQEKRVGVARRIHGHLRHVESSTLSDLRKANPGIGHSLVDEVVGNLKDASIVELFNTNTCNSAGDAIYRYRLSRITPAVIEAKLKWGLTE
jgi:hypothetical protein